MSVSGVMKDMGDAVCPGNVLLVDCNPPNEHATGKAHLVTQGGSVIKTWSSEALLFMAKPLPDGSIATYRRVVTEGNGTAQSGGAQMLFKIAPDNTATKLFYDYSLGALHHDFEVMPNGDLLVLTRKEVTDLAICDVPFYDEHITKVDGQTGAVIWSWSTNARFDKLGFTQEAKDIIRPGQTLYSDMKDVYHTNSIQVIPDNPSTHSAFRAGNILVSQRNTNLVFVIDQDTHKVVWKRRGISIGQHHAKVIPNGLPGAGNILMFNNGGRGGYPAQDRLFTNVIEYDPAASQTVWSYKSKSPATYGFFSPWRGSAQRLPNGNTFICNSQHGQLIETDPAGNVVWEYIVPFSVSDPASRTVYRAYKVDPAWPNGPAQISGLADQRWTW